MVSRVCRSARKDRKPRNPPIQQVLWVFHGSSSGPVKVRGCDGHLALLTPAGKDTQGTDPPFRARILVAAAIDATGTRQA